MTTPLSSQTFPQSFHRNSDDDGSSSDGEDSCVVDSTIEAGSDIVEGTSNSSSSGDKEIHVELKKEQRAVLIARYAVTAAIIVVAAVVASLVYIFTRRNDIHTFEIEYWRVTKTLIDQVQLQVQYNVAFMQMWSAELTSTSLIMGAQFPNFTHPHFEVDGGYTDGMGGIMMTAYAPLVLAEKQAGWEAYALENQGWLNESALLREVHPGHREPLNGTFQPYEGDRRLGLIPKVEENLIHPTIYKLEENGTKIPEEASGYKIMAPVWQSTPRNADVINADLLADPRLRQMFEINMKAKHTVMSPATKVGLLFDWMFDENEKEREKEPHAFLSELVYPRFDGINTMDPVGLVLGLTSYRNFFDNSLPEGTNGIVCVVEESCAQAFSYRIDGKAGSFIGFGDHHDPQYDKYLVSVPLKLFIDAEDTDLCPHVLNIYPSKVFADEYSSNQAWVFTGVILAAFAMTGAILFVYDVLVTRRQNKTMEAAVRSNRIVAQLYPKNVRDRLLGDDMETQNAKASRNARILGLGENSFDVNQGGNFATPPIADFFPETTVLFADLVGFTAWSSVREPAQVFILLETIYHAFDEIAKRRKVFKVETVGDCYVAVAGMPNPRKDHAIVMARFAQDCMRATWAWTKKLEISLGPDTADLTMRMGIHSGPVTGGVLRGERSRFQLFGDTMNVCSRIESNGERDRIHISQETAALITAAGKASWIKLREDRIVAKGKGELQTYWLQMHDPHGSETTSTRSSNSSQGDATETTSLDDAVVHEAPSQKIDSRTARLIDWNVDVLHRMLKQIVAHRKATSQKTTSIPEEAKLCKSKNGETVLDEVAEIITLPKFNATAASQREMDKVELPIKVRQQLKNYITNICRLYRKNPFHNFEHASHVTMSVTKLLSRIVATSDTDFTKEGTKEEIDVAMRHDHTYGITSDPLTQFACVLSALIHDADHPGVPNAQLVKEKAPIAEFYKGKSVAEQNSVDLAWNLLMEENYVELRACIYSTPDEMLHFRQLIVNAVMATDIVDKDLKALRNARWEKAFSGEHFDEDASHTVNRKATIVIEHLLQASDVAHTMQHWHIYRKWNERLFLECFKAFKDGRAGDNDPSEFWYKGEIGFFDFYIIPLAKKLKNCGVFGVSSEEYLNYAEKNRQEWIAKGEAVVEELVAKAKKELGKAVVEELGTKAKKELGK